MCLGYRRTSSLFIYFTLSGIGSAHCCMNCQIRVEQARGVKIKFTTVRQRDTAGTDSYQQLLVHTTASKVLLEAG